MRGVARHVAILVNPASGRGRAPAVAEVVADQLRAAGHHPTVLIGRDADDGLAQTRAAVTSGADTVVAVGGDGIVNLAVQALAGSSVPLGVVPAGAGNDFARVLGIPTDTQQAISILLAALSDDDPRTIDLGRCGERWFATVLASGFDSRVSERALRMSWPRGKARYNVAMLAELRVFQPIPYRIELDGAVIDTEAMMVTVGNTSCYGGGMRVAPNARCDDGLFDVVIVGPVSKRKFVSTFPRVYKGTHLSDPAIASYRAHEVALSAPGVTVFADGDPMGALPMTVECVPQALKVLVPTP